MKKLRIGVIGCGGMSRVHGRAWTAPAMASQVEIVGLCDPDRANLDRYQREIFEPVRQKPPVFDDYRALLESVPMDGVLIVTPHTQHFDQTMAALDAGCHVLVEKPMVMRADHARQLIARARKRKRIVSVAFPGPFSPEFAYIRRLMERGALGRVQVVDAFVSQNWLELTRGTWRQDPKLSGAGQAYDSGAHMFNAILYLTGLKPVEVFAWSDNRGTPVDIDTVAVIRLANGAFASATVAGNDWTGWDSAVHISGTKGTVRTAIHGGRVEQWDSKGRVQYPRVTPVPSMYQNFVDCIRGRAETPSPPVWGLRQALLMDALYHSVRTGKPVKIEVV